MAAITRVWVPTHLGLLLLGYLWLLGQSALDLGVLTGLWFFFPVGVIGAIIANATGTGGGVVFVPIFTALQEGGIALPPELLRIATLKPEESVAVSFAIQCFGMSVGALAWARAIFVKEALAWDERVSGQTLMALTFAPLATGVPALLLTQTYVEIAGATLLIWFKLFSLSLGITLLIFAWAQRRQAARERKLWVSPRELWALLGIGVIGGMVTALFSVGIGEFLAIYLILRRFPTKVAIAVAVWVSVVCVLVGVWDGYFAGLVRLEIVLIAVPGAVVGGALAKGIAQLLGALWLKTLASLWIIGSSLYLLLG
ncbi:sulfite exporter TauE/SafE family protein [Gymnodinialimonas ceratoperidinii]|uniref:Probable membrane transporter protein n=1 Tax=Gymnodinialimonas ceratoperidinii TaxID=2856823 RepID=A0A8F6TVG3_9RHOB|nr:sulfite exporter TauE/SafE family protein [Gymnodinialimonas ceratoperidinii]QXT38914.1 sulfite exporter TauE/SafE family protein [Gymnodinialimonas ceratoperidinii]